MSNVKNPFTFVAAANLSLYRRDIPIDHVLCVTNSLELGEIAFRSTLTNNVRPLTRDLTRFGDDHNLPTLRFRVRKGILILCIRMANVSVPLFAFLLLKTGRTNIFARQTDSSLKNFEI